MEMNLKMVNCIKNIMNIVKKLKKKRIDLSEKI